jgi:hypothetical protein
MGGCTSEGPDDRVGCGDERKDSDGESDDDAAYIRAYCGFRLGSRNQRVG